jgi:hypothetical protein
MACNCKSGSVNRVRTVSASQNNIRRTPTQSGNRLRREMAKRMVRRIT